MREAVVVLLPDVRGQQVVERGDRPAPRQFTVHLEPLGMLVEHRVDNVDEGLIAAEDAVPAGQQVPLQPALAQVLAEDLHDPSGAGKVLVDVLDPVLPHLVRDLVDVLKPVGGRLVRAEQPERLGVLADHVPEPGPQRDHGADPLHSRLRHRDSVVLVLRQLEVPQQHAAVRVRGGAHPEFARGGVRRDVRAEAPGAVEEFAGPVRFEPVPQLRQVLRVGAYLGQRHLMAPPRSFHLQPVDYLGPGPALRRAQHDHGPARCRGVG